MLLAEEGREVKGYLDMHRRSARGAPGADESLTLARESAEHVTTLNEISGLARELLLNPSRRTEMGRAARQFVAGERSLKAAAERLDRALGRLGVRSAVPPATRPN